MQSDSTFAIRAAIASGDYREALRLWNGYAGQLGEDLRRGTVSEEAFAEAGELVEWSRTTLVCARAHLADRLNRLYVARVYGSRASDPPAT